MRLRDRITCLSLIVLVLLVGPLGAQSVDEASRVRVLLVLDTDDAGGPTWGLDGENMKAMFEATLGKQKLGGRFTLDVVTGKQVTADGILLYYAQLKTEKTEALVFYYSGHGGYHVQRGHFLALRWGKLYRKDLIAAMKKHEPRLAVILTDCCANLMGGTAPIKEPTVADQGPTDGRDSQQSKVRNEEPPGGKVVTLKLALPTTLKRTTNTNPAKREEPAFAEGEVVGRLQPPLPRAENQEPPTSAANAAKLVTAAGKLSFNEIIDGSDGAVMRDLLFRNKGFVDINGCKKGALSHGTIGWGGSLFTNSLIVLQRNSQQEFDDNRNKVVEWQEFFPHLQKGTKAAGAKTGPSRIIQEPEMFHFVGPSSALVADPKERPARTRD
ncbi:MAG: hypothetical protein HY040_20925 [Planctomycetes bacterium]|nr:hypothetical protein [Planctomycetota bacterium]